MAKTPGKGGGGFGGKRAAPFKSGGGRSKAHPNTAKGTPRKAPARGK